MKHFIVGAAILGLVQSNIAQAQEPDKCVPPAQAEALITYILPKAVKAARSKCSLILPTQAALMEENSERLTNYQIASEAAWPKAREAVKAIAGEKIPRDIDDTILKPMTDAIFIGMISQEIKSKNCALIDKIYTDLAPMPSTNIASLTVTIIQAAAKDDDKTNLPICKPPA
jgi:hypothetical protein